MTIYDSMVNFKADHYASYFINLIDGSSFDKNQLDIVKPGPNKKYWHQCEGVYQLNYYNKPAKKYTLKIRNGYLYLDDFLLREYRENLFFAGNGWSVECGNKQLLISGITLQKIMPDQ